MKRCPSCNRQYDDEVRFCLEDGTTLLRTGPPVAATLTMPAQSGFQTETPAAVQRSADPSMSVGATLANIFIAPARAFTSFRDVTAFAPTAVRLLIALAIILVALIAYSALYQTWIGYENIARAAVEASPRISELPSETRERTLQITQNPFFRIMNLVTNLGRIFITVVVGLPLGALIYWLGGMIFKAPLKYGQSLLVWAYATLPPVVLWSIANIVTLFVWPPTTNVGIVTGATGVFPSNPGALFAVTTLPLPAHVVAISALDLFEFYGLALAVVGLRKAGGLPWIGAAVTVAAVWTIGLIWRITTATLVNIISQ